MAKKGSTRPWRLTFEWASGIKDTQTFATHWDAEAKWLQIVEASNRNGTQVKGSIVNPAIMAQLDEDDAQQARNDYYNDPER